MLGNTYFTKGCNSIPFFFREKCGLSGAVFAGDKLSDLKGPYLGQTPPGVEAVLFAPEIITYDVHDSPTFSPDGRKIMIGSMGEGFKYYRMQDEYWISGEELPLKIPGICNGLFMSPSGRKALIRIWNPNSKKAPFYVSERLPEGWTEPRLIEGKINSYKTHWQFSAASNDNLYFPSEDKIYLSVFNGDRHLDPRPLKLEDGSDLRGDLPFISPDESYIIYTIITRLGEKKVSDLHISYRTENDKWTTPINLGPTINAENSLDFCPVVSPDGKYLFFTSRRDDKDWRIYWADAGFIESLRP